jgi:hypothetical protein
VGLYKSCWKKETPFPKCSNQGFIKKKKFTLEKEMSQDNLEQLSLCNTKIKTRKAIIKTVIMVNNT